MIKINDILIVSESSYEPTEEDERNHWSGVGSITFFVQQNINTGPYPVFEIEIEEYTGCAGGADETLGLPWLIKNELGIEKDQLKEGHTYTIEKLTVEFLRGDGWEIDDDVNYYFENLKDEIQWFRFLKQKLTNLWWQNIGWRIKKWQKKK